MPTPSSSPAPTRRERRAAARQQAPANKIAAKHSATTRVDWTGEAVWALPAVLAAIVVFVNALHGGFVYDDLRQIARNALVQDPSQFWRAMVSDVWAFKGGAAGIASSYWRPTFVLWLIANARAFGDNAVGFHATNLLLHAIVTALAYALARRLDLSRPLAAMAALLFAVHPVHTESVAWISGSPDLLLSIGWIGTTLAVLSLLDAQTPRRWVVALGLYAFAVGAKEVAILFPLMVVIVARWRAGAPAAWRAALALAAPFAALGAIYFVARLAIIGALYRSAEKVATPAEALLSAPAVLAFYLRQTFLPFTIGPSYPLRPVPIEHAAMQVLPLLAVLAIAALAWLAARRSPAGGVGLALFLLPLTPAMNIVAFVPDQIVHDRYLYLPLLGAYLVAVPAIADVYARLSKADAAAAARTAALLLLAPAALLAWQTWHYNRVWTSELALWERAVATDPTGPRNFIQHSAALFDLQRYEEARTSADRALALSETADAHLGRGRARLELGDVAGAAADFQWIVAAPLNRITVYASYQGYEALAIARDRDGDLGQAEAVLRAGRDRLPMYSAALTEKLAVVLYRAGRRADALAELERARAAARSELLPESRIVLLRLGMLYAEAGRQDDARATLGEYLALTAYLIDDQTRDARSQAADLLRSLGR